MGRITVRYFAGARAAAGTPAETIEAGDLEALVTGLAEQHGEPLGRVLAVASFLVDGTVCRDRKAPLPAGCAVDVLPPFAGG